MGGPHSIVDNPGAAASSAAIDRTSYVSDQNGSDATGDGSISKPYKTIAFAITQIPSHANSYSTWANERWTIYCEPGRYTEAGPIIFRQVRRSMRLYGDGAVIENEVRFKADIADYPDGALFNPLLVPVPWGPPTVTVPLCCFEFAGESGGMEGGHPANNLILLGRVVYELASAGLGPIGAMFWFMKFVQSFGGMEYEQSVSAMGLTVEIEGSSVINGHIGSNTAGSTFTMKAHNSQLRSTIGPFCTILEMDSCRVSAMDRLTDFSGGAIAGAIVSSVTTSQCHIQNCAFNGSVYNLGQPAAGGILIMDEVSLRRLLAQAGVVFTNCVARIHDVLSGTTAARPTTIVERGTRYYDTTLSVPIWREPASGTGWVNGSGVAV